MIRFCAWLLDRFVHDDLRDHIVGDLLEQRHRGALWLLRETTSAILRLRGKRLRGDGMISTFVNDARLGVRHLRRSPGFAVTSVVTLGLAIGATAAIFSVIEPVLIRPLPYPAPGRLAFIWERDRDGSRDNVGYATIRDLAEQSRSLQSWAAIGSWQPTVGDAEPERLSGDRVSWMYFRTLGVQPAIGRDFLAAEDDPDHNTVVILAHGLWQRKFAGDSNIVGRQISIGGTPMTVVGVMPESFDNVVSPGAEIWRVLGYATTLPYACRTCHHLRMIARLAPSVSLASAATELDHIHARLEKAFPKEYASVGASVVRIQDEMTRDIRPALLAVTGAVVLVLLIAFANVINLQLARAVRRQEEFAIRVALGAGRGRLTLQLLAEGLVVASLGGLTGVAVARLSLPLLVARLPNDLPRLHAIHLDATAVGVVAALVLGLSVIMALVPGLRRDHDLGSSLRSGRRLASAAQHLTRSTLVVGEIAFATMLLLSAGLVARSLIRLLGVNAGFDPSRLLTMEFDAVGPRYGDAPTLYDYHDRVLAAVRGVPGVAGVAVANQLPMAGNVDMYGVIDADNPPANPELVPSGDRYCVSTEYLSMMRIPIIHGRAFTEAESRDTSNRVALISAALAEREWPGQNPLGKRIRMGGPDGPTRTIIGVTGNVKHRGLDAATTLQWYVPERQWLFADNHEMLVVRTTGDAAAIAPSVQRAIASVDRTSPIIHVATMERLVEASTAQRRLALTLFGAFAAAAVLLAVAGVYGVLSGSVAERTREIGIRSALGAAPREIVALVVRQGTTLGVAGIVGGLIGGAALTRFLRTLLFGIGEKDPATLAGVVAALLAVTLVACAIPASRAVRIDPVEALRSE